MVSIRPDKLPINLDAEKALLGSILIRPTCLFKVLKSIEAASFSSGANRSVFEAIAYLHDNKKPIDVVTLSNRLKETGDLAVVGGNAFLAELSSSVPMSSNVGAYISIVEECKKRRDLIIAAHNIISVAENDAEKIDSVVDNSMRQIQKAVSDKSEDISIDRAIDSFDRRQQRILSKEGDYLGTPIGIKEFDDLVDGLQEHEMSAVTAETSGGKTSFGVFCASQFIKQGKKVVFHSMEMSDHQMITRLLGAMTDFNMNDILRNNLNDAQKEEVKRCRELISSSRSVLFSERRWEKAKNTYKSECMDGSTAFVLMDYIGLSSTDNSQEYYHLLRTVAADVQDMSTEFPTHFMMISQMSKQGATHAKNSGMVDTKGSADIANSAALVIRLESLEDSKEEREIRQKNKLYGPRLINIQKDRNGPTGSVTSHFRYSSGNWIGDDEYRASGEDARSVLVLERNLPACEIDL